MKRLLFCAALASVAACGKGEDGSNVANSSKEATEEALADYDGPSVGQLLRDGKPEACAHPLVKARFAEYLQFDEQKVLQDNPEVTQADVDEAVQSLGEPVLANYSAVDADAAVHELLCEVYLTINQNRGTGMRFQYVLRPSLENDDDYQLRWMGVGMELMRGMVVSGEARSKAAARAAQSEPKAAENPFEAVPANAM